MMKALIRVVIASHLKNNGQYIQREVIHAEFDLKEGEEVDNAYLDLCIKGEGWIPLIKK